MLEVCALDVENEADWFIEQFSISGGAEDIEDLSQALQRGLASYGRGVPFGEAVVSALRRRANQVREAQHRNSVHTTPAYTMSD